MNKEDTRDKIRGMFLGVAIGDALGMPLEFLSEDERKKKGWVDKYISPDGHKWFNGRKAGTWTDDWFYTRLVAESIIACGGIDLDDLAKRHADSYRSGEYKIGAGKATREALKKLAEGIHWSLSGTPNAGGNGVAMKVAPLGAFLFLQSFNSKRIVTGKEKKDFYQNAIKLALMTHNSQIASASALAHVFIIYSCFFEQNPLLYKELFFWDLAISGSRSAEKSTINGFNKNAAGDKLSQRFEDFSKGKYDKQETSELVKTLGPDKGYVYFTLPFCYAIFIKEPVNINTLYKVVNAGGDTDTNGSIAGALLGAYNGTSIFPMRLIKGLDQHEAIFDLADRFYQKFAV